MKLFRHIRKSTVAVLLALTFILSTTCVSFAEIHLNATILPESDDPLDAVLTINDQALGLLIPAQNGIYYVLYWEDLAVILSEILGLDLSELNIDELDEELLTSLALRYGKIIISVAGIFNFSRKKMNYELSAFHSSPQCVVWTCSPSRRDWTKMLKKLFTTALSDEDLSALLPYGATELIYEGQNHIDDIVNAIDGLSLQAAIDDNNIYAVKLSRHGEDICYQYPGDHSSEHAIVYEEDGNSIILVYALSDFNPAALSELPHRISSAEELTEVLSVFIPYLPAGIGSKE